MSKFEIYSDDKIILLKKRIDKDIELTEDNIKQKILELPVLFTKYKKLHLDQEEILNNINTEISKTRKKLYHHYKFDYDFKLDSASEIKNYVDGDNEMCNLNFLYDKQNKIVKLLDATVSNITKLSYLIRSYVDLEKLRNGVMS